MKKGQNKIELWLLCLGMLIIIHPFSNSLAEEKAPSLVLSLEKAVEIALENNFGIKNANYDVDLAKSDYLLARDAFSLKLSSTSDVFYSFYDDQNQNGQDTKDITANLGLGLSKRSVLTGGNFSLFSSMNRYELADNPEEENYRYSHTFGVRFDQPLLKNRGYKVNKALITTAYLDFENSQWTLQLQQEITKYRVIKAYYEVLKAKKLIEVNKFAVEQAEIHLQNTRIKLEEGLVAQIDVSQAELQLSQKKNLLVFAEASTQDKLDQFKLLLALPLEADVNLSLQVKYEPEEIDEQTAIQEALKNRYEKKIAEHQLYSAELGELVNNNARLPEVDLSLRAQVINKANKADDAFSTENPEYQAGLSLKYVFGDKTARENYIKANLSRKKLDNKLRELEQEIIAEVKSVIREYQTLKKNILILEQAVQQAEYGLALATASYKEGLIKNIDMLKAQDELLQAKSDYISALMDFETSKARILLALGREIEPSSIKLNP